MVSRDKAAPFFAGWDETMIWSYLQGYMGRAVADDDENPSAVQIILGDFCFFAGKPCAELAARAAAPILVPKDCAWSETSENVWGADV